MNILKQSTAATIKLGPFIDDGDGKTAKTGLTISQADIRLSKNGGDFAQKNNATGATHDEFGYYDIPLNTTDTGTLGRLRVAVSESGALPVWQDFLVVTANVYDTLCSTDKLDVAAVELKSTQGAITWGQQKIIANVANEGALHIHNSNSNGVGQQNYGEKIGLLNLGASTFGMENVSSGGMGQHNGGASGGVYNQGAFGTKNEGGIGVHNIGTGTVGVQNEGNTIGEYNVSEDGIGQLNAGGTNSVYNDGQQKIIANVAGEGALDIENTSTAGGGVGIHTEGQFAGQFNEGTGGSSNGTFNTGVGFGLNNQGYIGQLNNGSFKGVDGFDSDLATADNLAAVKSDTAAILADTGTDGVKVASGELLSEIVVGTYTVQDILKILSSVLAGKASGGRTSTITYRSIDDTANAVVETVDTDGNRIAVTYTV